MRTVIGHQNAVSMRDLGSDRIEQKPSNSLALHIGTNGDICELKRVARPILASAVGERREDATRPRLMRGRIVSAGEAGDLVVSLRDGGDKPWHARHPR